MMWLFLWFFARQHIFCRDLLERFCSLLSQLYWLFYLTVLVYISWSLAAMLLYTQLKILMMLYIPVCWSNSYVLSGCFLLWSPGIPDSFCNRQLAMKCTRLKVLFLEWTRFRPEPNASVSSFAQSEIKFRNAIVYQVNETTDLSVNVKDDVANGQLKHCLGTHFVRGVTYGAEMVASLSIKSSSSSEK